MKGEKRPAQSIVIYAKNKVRVSAFYRRTLQIAVVEDERTHTLLRGRGIELLVHAIAREYAAQIKIAKPPHVREDTPLKPVFLVQSLELVRIAAADTGGYLQPPAKAWQYDGTVVLDGNDPEGNVVQFRQLIA